MNLQLADGSLNNPIGIVEAIIVESCGIEYEHTFAIVDFGVIMRSFWVDPLCANSKCFKIGDLTTCILDKKHLLQESTSRIIPIGM